VAADDIRKVHDTHYKLEKFPSIFATIDLVYVLSGRGSALKQAVDHPLVDDPEDDYYRMRKAVRIAKKASRFKKEMVPIFYNGRAKHNEHLRQALELGVFDYPKELFIIKSIAQENTIGQIESFKTFLDIYPHPVIALISSTYHLPRVGRGIGNASPTVLCTDTGTSNLENSTLLLFGIDRQFKRAGVLKDIQGELNAMKNYSSNITKPATIAREQCTNTYLNVTDVLFQWSFNLQKQQSRLLTASHTPSAHALAKPSTL
jgi:hypothetical protein